MLPANSFSQLTFFVVGLNFGQGFQFFWGGWGGFGGEGETFRHF